MKALEKDLAEQTQIIKDPSNTSNYQVIQQAMMAEERLEKEYLDLLERTVRIEQTLA